MSKWAIEGLTKAMAEELPSGMAAVPLNPGVIDTEIHARMGDPERADRIAASVEISDPSSHFWADRHCGDLL